MTNWCSNTLRVLGPEQAVTRFRERAIGFYPGKNSPLDAQPSVLSFHSLIPIPPERMESRLRLKWEMENWGCETGAYEARLAEDWDDGLIYEFDTAWSPPIEFLERVSTQWPDLIFVLEYEEPDEGYKGLAKAVAGVTEDHFIRLR